MTGALIALGVIPVNGGGLAGILLAVVLLFAWAVNKRREP